MKPHHSRLRALLFLAVAVLLATAAFLPADAKKRKKKRKKKKKKKELPEVSVSRYEYCHSCIAVVEQFHKAVEDIANSREFKRDVKNNEINGTEIAANLWKHHRLLMPNSVFKARRETVRGGRERGVPFPERRA